MLTQVHLVLAALSAVTTALVAAEAAWRAARDAPQSTLSRRLATGQLAALLTTTVIGLVLVANGAQPSQSVHPLLAFAALLLPFAASTLTNSAVPRVRAAATSLAALLALVLVALLFMTG